MSDAVPAIDGYADLALIGTGGFSRVYEAHQAKFARQVAVKVMNFGLHDETDRSRFERETRLMGRVSTHPNIVTVHDTAFTQHGQPCIVMELYSGGSLADMVNAVGPLDAEQAVDVGVAIASALEASHEAGVLHCDLKPQNILVSDFGEPALGDFGISTFVEDHTRTGSAGGAGFTLHYAAPEVVEGESPSVASDVYSLGATLYAALAGRQPFGGDAEKPAASELARRVLLDEPASLTSLGVPPGLDLLLRQTLSKDPADRPQSAGELAQRFFDLGRQLGFRTRPPSSALSQASTPVEEEITVDRAGAVQPSTEDPFRPLARRDDQPRQAVARGPQIEESDTVGRAQEAPPVDQPSNPFEAQQAAEVEPAGPTRSRRVAALALALLSMLAALFVVWFLNRGDEAVNAEPEATAVAAPVDPVLAPPSASDVSIERTGVSSVAVSWVGVDDPSVTYRVQRSDVEVDPVETTGSEVTLTGVSSSDSPCVVVVARRANRVANPTEPVCLGPKAGGSVAIRPETCERGSCDARLVLDEYPANTSVSILVLDPNGDDVNGFGEIYESRADTDARGRIDSWRLRLPPLLPAGRYLVVVADDVGESFSAPLEVVETAE